MFYNEKKIGQYCLLTSSSALFLSISSSLLSVSLSIFSNSFFSFWSDVFFNSTPCNTVRCASASNMIENASLNKHIHIISVLHTVDSLYNASTSFLDSNFGSNRQYIKSQSPIFLLLLPIVQNCLRNKSKILRFARVVLHDFTWKLIPGVLIRNLQ